MSTPVSFAVMGSGFRTRALLDVAARRPTVRCVGAVVRTPRRLDVPSYPDLDACRAQTPVDFVITATPWTVTPEAIVAAVDRGLPVLAETPPAPDLDGLRALWSAVRDSGLVQVAEQYLMMPAHAARLALVRSGRIGTPTQVQVSSTQQYHAVSLIRGLLGVDRRPVTVRATRFSAPLVSPLSRSGWTDDLTARPTTTTIATLDFGELGSGVYDYTDQQTRNLLRSRRLLVRGTEGELDDDEVVSMAGPRTLVRSAIRRRQTGHDLDLNGYDTEHLALADEVLYRNPYLGQRWNDDEIAIATLLDRTAAWVRGEGPAPYPLADGIHDHQVALAIERAADTDATVVTTTEAWTSGAADPPGS